MKNKEKDPIFYSAHYLSTCRLDNWIRLLVQNKFRISLRKIPQTIYMLLTSLVMTPFTILESLIFAIPIRKHKIKKDPVFIIGHWRSGTTYLQNLMSRDKQFGWCDPVSTSAFCNSYLLGWLLSGIMGKAIKQARPMDNMEYKLDLPMEDAFAFNLISTQTIIHLLVFPENYEQYLNASFISEQPEHVQEKWRRDTMYVLKKMSLRKGGKQLMLKSPDHSCHVDQLMELFPDAKYVNIHRDPYVTVMSTINMFKKQMHLIRLNEIPDNLDELLEDVIVDLFGHIYRNMFELEDSGAYKEKSLVNIAYDELASAPEDTLRKIYSELELDGFEEALPNFRAHIDSVKSYKKNKFQLEPQLRDKINNKLGFYFERYGYEMDTE